LPRSVLRCLENFEQEKIDEIRIRKNGTCSITENGKNIAIDASLSDFDFERIISEISGGSLYSYAETLKKGYLTLPCGARVGISGQAVTENGRVVGLNDITSFVFRIPRSVHGAGEYIVHLLKRYSFSRGILIYSPPGMGKTTVLRDVCRILGGGEQPLRVAVVDTRDEICRGEKFGTVDVLRGFERAEGIEIAVRTLSPQIIVCDEIGSEADAEAILALRHCGVPLLASAHAASISDLLMRPFTKSLDSAGIFAGYVGLLRGEGGLNYRFEKSEKGELSVGAHF